MVLIAYMATYSIIGVFTIIVDVIKTRYLTDGGAKYKSIADCIQQTYRGEGVQGFFRVSQCALFCHS